jgi:hypothetical protein
MGIIAWIVLGLGAGLLANMLIPSAGERRVLGTGWDPEALAWGRPEVWVGPGFVACCASSPAPRQNDPPNSRIRKV